MLLRHALGQALRRIRLERGLTLRELSERSRVSMPYLSEIERGRKEASSEILDTILRVFDLTLLDLLREVADEAFVLDLTPTVDVTPTELHVVREVAPLPAPYSERRPDIALAA